MTNTTITYEQSVEALENELEHAADVAHDELVRMGLDEDQRFEAMQEFYLKLDEARARGMQSIKRIWSLVSPHESGTLH